MPTNTTTIANQTATNSTITQQIIHHAWGLGKALNDWLQATLVPILAPYLGQSLARVAIYILLILGGLYTAKKLVDGWMRYVLIAVVVLLLLAYISGGGGG